MGDFPKIKTETKNNKKKKKEKAEMTPGLMEEGSWKGKHKHKEWTNEERANK